MLLKSTLLYGPAVLFPRIAAFSIVVLLSHLIPPEEFGLYALCIVVGEATDMSCSGWVRTALLRFDASSLNGLRSGLLVSARLLAVTNIAALFICIACAFALAPERYAEFSISTVAYVLANTFLRFGLTTLQIQRDRVTYSLIEVGRSIAMVSAILVIATRPDASFFSTSITVSFVTFVSGAAAVLMSLHHMPSSSGLSAGICERLTYGSPIVVVTILAYLLMSTDRIFLKLFSGAALMGVYAAAYAIARQPVDVMSNAINQGSFPELIRIHDTEGPSAAAEFLADTLFFASMLLIPALGFLAGSAVPICSTFLPDAYVNTGAQIIPWVALAAVLYGFKAYVFDNVFHVAKKNWMQCATLIPAGIVAVSGHVIFVPKFGALGAACSVCAGTLTGLVAAAVMARRLLPFRIRTAQFFGSLAIGIAVMTAAATPQVFLVSSSSIVQLAVGAVASAVVYVMCVAFWSRSLLAAVFRKTKYQ